MGVVGDSWVLKTDPISVTWFSISGVGEEFFLEITSALYKDVDSLKSNPITMSLSYFYGKAIARAARLALIAEEEIISPWLDGSFNGNGFLYDRKWGGADFGFGIFNDQHYHLGYFLYAIAVLCKIDPAWGRKYRPQAYSMAGGLSEFAVGRNQVSTSEAVNAYYSAALMGLSFGDTHLVAIGSMLAAFEMQAAQMWSHSRVVGVLWINKRDSGLWFAPPEWRDCRLGIQMLSLLPITEVLLSDVGFSRDLVKWTVPALARDGVGEGWKGFVYAMEAIYDKETGLQKTRALPEAMEDVGWERSIAGLDITVIEREGRSSIKKKKDMYNSGGAVESVNFSGGSSNCQLNIRGRGPGHFGAYSSRRPTSCTVISREAEFHFVDRDFLLTVSIPPKSISWEIGILYEA
ncbi:hypothetical protein ACLOJK_029659 [Asimina triloba]